MAKQKKKVETTGGEGQTIISEVAQSSKAKRPKAVRTVLYLVTGVTNDGRQEVIVGKANTYMQANRTLLTLTPALAGVYKFFSIYRSKMML